MINNNDINRIMKFFRGAISTALVVSLVLGNIGSGMGIAYAKESEQIQTTEEKTAEEEKQQKLHTTAGVGRELDEILEEIDPYVLEKGFDDFLEKSAENYQKAEYLLPTIVGGLLRDGKADVTVLHSNDQWFGVTYKEDKPGVVAALQSMKDKGQYPDELWRSL